MILTFGKHRGKELKDVPSDYLQWLMEELEDNEKFNERNPELYEGVEEEIEIRDRSDGHFYGDE